jgi:hypothetical protein
MVAPHMPLGVLGKIVQWLKDFFLMPGRVRRIAETAETDSDKRPVCMSCGKGMVATMKTWETVNYQLMTLGVCENCKQNWIISADGRKLERLCGPDDHR